MNRALLVGIDNYPNFGNLGGCVNDATAVAALLERNEDPPTVNFQCEVMTAPVGAELTTDVLKEAIERCFSSGPEVALFFFAGHGAEEDGSDVVLCSTNGTDRSPGVEFSFVMEEVLKSPVKQKVIILDCCFSGGAGGLSQLNLGEAAVLPPGTTILAASRGDQESFESERGQGLFSEQVCAALAGGAADSLGNVTAAGLYSYLDQSFGAWEQRPTLRANVDRLQLLRTCKPAIRIDEVHALAAMFPDVTEPFPLDPSFEPELEPKSAANEMKFAVLQRGRAAKLVNPVTEDHLFFEAKKSGACKLTPLGQHYCQAVHENRM